MDKKTTLFDLHNMKQQGENIACLTAYDASFAMLLDAARLDIILVGDSLGMVLHGKRTTLHVTLADMIYHARQVSRVARHAFIIADMPFMSYATPQQALDNAARLFAEGGCEMVKLEGGTALVETVRQLSTYGLPVCAHLGLQPQFVHRLGGYRAQGRDQQSAQNIIDSAQQLQDAGAALLVLECVDKDVARELTETLTIPTIGIGAGRHCDGQVLVLYDMLGISPSAPSFAKDFLRETNNIACALERYVAAVKAGDFPAL